MESSYIARQFGCNPGGPVISFWVVGLILAANLFTVPMSVAEVDLSIPFEKRVCRLYFHSLRPDVWDGEKRVTRKPGYGLTPEELSDIVAEMGTEVWSTSASYTDHGAYWPSDMVKRCDKIPRDYMSRMVDRAHEHGITVLALEQLVELENTPLPPYSKVAANCR